MVFSQSLENFNLLQNVTGQCKKDNIIQVANSHVTVITSLPGGSGKQSLTKLAAFAAGCEVFEITLSRGYDESNFREDLKILYNKLGVEKKQMVFLFTDAHVAQEGFLELINNMLTSGMVPALFADDEKEAIVGNVSTVGVDTINYFQR